MTYQEILAATRHAHDAMRDLDREALDGLQRIYQDAYGEIADKIRHAGAHNDLIELARLVALRAEINRILSTLETVRNAQLTAAINRAARLGVVPGDALAVAVDMPGSAAAQRIAQDAVRFVERFIAKDGLQLSDRLWRMDTAARQTLQNAVTRAVVSGQNAAAAARDLLSRGEPVGRDVTDKMQEASATRLSNQVRAMVKGEGNPMANAMRVMRTETNRAHGEAFIASMLKHPELAGLRFQLSPAHPRPDICDLLSIQNLHGLGAGVYPDRVSLPWPAHPNTLSFVSPVFKDQVTEADRAGKETQRDALARLTNAQRQGALGVERASLFEKGKFRSDMLPEAFRA